MKDHSIRKYIILAIILFIIIAVIIGLLIKVNYDKAHPTTTTSTTTEATTTATVNSPIVELVVEDGEVVHKPVDDFKAYITATDKPVFVDFWAAWCGPCIQAAPFVESLALDYWGQAHVLKVDVDRSPELVQEYKISGIPLFIVFQDGKQQDSMAGYGTSIEGAIRKMLTDLLD